MRISTCSGQISYHISTRGFTTCFTSRFTGCSCFWVIDWLIKREKVIWDRDINLVSAYHIDGTYVCGTSLRELSIRADGLSPFSPLADALADVLLSIVVLYFWWSKCIKPAMPRSLRHNLINNKKRMMAGNRWGNYGGFRRKLLSVAQRFTIMFV